MISIANNFTYVVLTGLAGTVLDRHLKYSLKYVRNLPASEALRSACDLPSFVIANYGGQAKSPLKHGADLIVYS